MTNPMQQLLDFHNTRNFGNRENLITRQHEAKAIYARLTPDQQMELAETAINHADEKHSQHEEILCCLTCFQPGSLANFHIRLVERRILYPSVILVLQDNRGGLVPSRCYPTSSHFVVCKERIRSFKSSKSR